MIIINNFKNLRTQLSTNEIAGKTVGFVPTMGAFHSGHASLVKRSKEMSDLTVCSIFVNPLQFNNREDFLHYPVTLEKDISLLEELGCDILFLPTEMEVYPDEASKTKHYDLGYLENILEGKFRPGHFQGVCLVVDRLLSMVKPDLLFLGQKDFQQCLVIEKLIQITGAKIKLIKCPIVREESGLAKSSRNLRLSESELKKAAELYKSLLFINQNSGNQSFSRLQKEATTRLENSGFKIEYIALANAHNLFLEEDFKSGVEQIILIAAYLNEIRLIDNLNVK
jgi:pantoate--beta-alanine ligase